MMLQRVPEWKAACSATVPGKTIDVTILFKGEVPRNGERLPLPAGCGLYANGRRHVSKDTTEVFVEAEFETVETVAAWLTSAETKVPANIAGWTIHRRYWKIR